MAEYDAGAIKSLEKTQPTGGAEPLRTIPKLVRSKP